MNKKSLDYACLFGGGAIRGVAYCGAVRALEELGINPQIIAGSSVGAAVAALLAVGYSSEELEENFMKVNFEVFRDIQLGFGPQFAISKGRLYEDWIRELIEKKFYGENYQKEITSRITFSDIEKNLVIITTDLSNFTCKEFSKQATPDFEIAQAVRISCGMPGLMSPVEYNNKVLIDGDLQKACPMWKLSKNLQPDDKRILEFRLEGDFKGNDLGTIEYLNSIYSYATSVSTDLIKEIYNKNDKYDCIAISTGALNLVDFNIPKEKRADLIKSGYEQTIRYFKTDLKEKKEGLAKIYSKIFDDMSLIDKNIKLKNIRRSREILADLFMYLCDYVCLLDEKDYELLKDFRDNFVTNLIYPSLFGKMSLKNNSKIKELMNVVLSQIKNKKLELVEYNPNSIAL